MSDLPAITVAVPTYNGAKHIEAALRSILDQSEVRFDLLVSDDRSSDDTIDRIERIAGDRARIEVNSERLGLAGNWNRCVDRARTEFVAIFHQDDVMRPGRLATHLAAFSPEVGMTASASTVIDAEGRPIAPDVVDPGGCGPTDRLYPPGAFLSELAWSNPLRCSAVTIRAEAHRRIGGFDPSFRYVIDWDEWIKIARSWAVAWVARPTVEVRWHPSSETHTFKTGTADLEETARLLEDLYRSEPSLASFRKRADERLARAYLNRAYDAAKAGRGALTRKSLRRAFALDHSLIRAAVVDLKLFGRLLLGSLRR